MPEEQSPPSDPQSDSSGTIDLEQGIATKYELDALYEARETPAPSLTLTPEGPYAAEVNRDMAQWREGRIGYLEERLDMAREKFEEDVNPAFDGTLEQRADDFQARRDGGPGQSRDRDR